MFKATLSSDERLKSRKRINYLFDEGSQLFSHPLKVYYIIKDIPQDRLNGLDLKFGVSVPKSLYRKAVARNKLRRKIKESYRINKAAFKNANPDLRKSVDWFFIYIDRKASVDKIDSAMLKIFSDIKQKLTEDLA